MESYDSSGNGPINWFIFIVIAVIVIIAVIYIAWIVTSSKGDSSDKNIKNVAQIKRETSSEIPPEPLPSYPKEFPGTTCIRANGTKTKCGYESRVRSGFAGSSTNIPEGAIPELLLRNNSPISLDIYHRPPNGTKFIFTGTMPTMQELYVYKDKEGNNFYKNSELFATRHKETKILFLPVSLDPSETKIVWGLSSSNIDESVVTINLLGEISHIKFRNYSYATYKLYYYNEYLGELKPYQKEEGTYYELYVHRGGQGFRIGSKVTIVMEGSEQPQDITLDKINMTTLNIGLALAEKNSNEN